jgi:hypothetical protein
MRTLRLTLLFLIALSACAIAETAPQKQVVGATEVIHVVEANLRFKARVDTGAKSCSIHAVDIQVDAAGKPKGKPISFRVVGADGQSRRINARIDSAVIVESSGSSERRYKVPLTLEWNNRRKTVLVTLNDRRTMAYPLLLGRNWLRGDYVVDVERNSDD